MSYLILTPDGVGSTILQRVLSIALYLEKVAVQNTHELTNGLVLENNIVKKEFSIEYGQSLDDITNILQKSSPNVKLVSRIAKYHIDNRGDDLNKQKKFYSFLNKFYDKKIMCLRKNVFEYAMSWSIRKKSQIQNVYEKADRDKVQQVKQVDEEFFVRKCKEYVNYIEWVENNFPNVLKIYYEDLITDADKILEKITLYKNTFTKKFSIDLSSILKIEYKYTKPFFLQKNIDKINKDEIQILVNYRDLCKELTKKGLILHVPVKNTVLEDKKNQIENFDQCLNIFYSFAKNYNWIDQSIATYDFWNKKYLC